MRSTDYISKGTAVARLYKARESLLMDKDCRRVRGVLGKDRTRDLLRSIL